MSEDPSEFEHLLGHAALRLWSDLPAKSKRSCSKQQYPLILCSETGWRFFFTTAIPGRLIRLSQPSWHSCFGRCRKLRSAPSPLAAYGVGGCF
jgi:hypothetical protein